MTTNGASSIQRSPALDGALIKRLSNTTVTRAKQSAEPSQLAVPALDASRTDSKVNGLVAQPMPKAPPFRPLQLDQPFLKDQLLNSADARPRPSLAPESTGPGRTPTDGSSLTPQQTLDGIHAHWGQAHEAYDLDQDGIVGMSDLLQLLGNWPDRAAEQTPPPVEPSMNVAGSPSLLAPPTGEAPDNLRPDENPAKAPQHPEDLLTGIRKAWGSDDAAFDLTGDGSVGIDDLLHLLSNWTVYQDLHNGTTPDNRPLIGAGPNIETPTALASEPYRTPETAPTLTTTGVRTSPVAGSELQNAIDRLAKLLDQARTDDGTSTKNAVDLRTTVSELKLPPNLEQAVLARFSKMFPPGKNLNLLG